MQSDMRIELFDIETCAIEELFIIIIIIITQQVRPLAGGPVWDVGRRATQPR